METDTQNLVPELNLNIDLPEQQPKSNPLVEPNTLLDYCKEITDDIEEDREETEELIKNFNEMLMNDGEPSNSTKEALVNLMKIKSDTVDKKIKVMDLLMRAFLKERDTFPRYLSASVNQNNKISISTKRKLLESMEEE